MIAIVTIIFLSISILLSTFLGFSPNFYKLTEGDFMRRADFNTIIYGLQHAEVSLRAKTLANPDKNKITLAMGYLRKKNTSELDDMKCDLELTAENKIKVAIKYKHSR